jgi:uncharacterized protein YqeY
MRGEISAALKDAMLKQDRQRMSTLRLVSAAIKNADIEARSQGKPAPSNEALLGLLQKLIKQRQESAELYQKGGRPELAAQEREEIAIIQGFLPAQLGEEAVRAAIAGAITATGASGIKDMGKVMAALKSSHAGQIDFGEASAIVKAMLG